MTCRQGVKHAAMWLCGSSQTNTVSEIYETICWKGNSSSTMLVLPLAQKFSKLRLPQAWEWPRYASLWDYTTAYTLWASASGHWQRWETRLDRSLVCSGSYVHINSFPCKKVCTFDKQTCVLQFAKTHGQICKRRFWFLELNVSSAQASSIGFFFPLLINLLTKWTALIMSKKVLWCVLFALCNFK